ncbi:MAG: flagellar hook-associated protein FlgL [Syntrophomonadaceae bacterium]|jgi:flagellar hook-associated protein 3 FlgL|nr:flagellar hook-associated protein FlgL [Syntrophomonadaceae bacterium]
MRITNNMLKNNVLQNLNHNLSYMAKVQRQMSSGKAVTRPSDDPIATAQILTYKTVLAEMDQHARNMDDAIGWLEVSESALNHVTKVLQRARELAVYGASGTIPSESRQALAQEVGQLVEEMAQAANTSYAGRYVFGGSVTHQPPFVHQGSQVVYAGNDFRHNWEVAPGVTVAVNISGQEAFQIQADNTGKVFQVMLDLKTALENSDMSQVSASIQTIENATNHILEQRAVLGAKSNRLQVAKERAQEAHLETTKLLSQLEDVDLAEAIIRFKSRESAYHAALSTAAMVLQPSLINFLR